MIPDTNREDAADHHAVQNLIPGIGMGDVRHDESLVDNTSRPSNTSSISTPVSLGSRKPATVTANQTPSPAAATEPVAVTGQSMRMDKNTIWKADKPKEVRQEVQADARNALRDRQSHKLEEMDHTRNLSSTVNLDGMCQFPEAVFTTPTDST